MPNHTTNQITSNQYIIEKSDIPNHPDLIRDAQSPHQHINSDIPKSSLEKQFPKGGGVCIDAVLVQVIEYFGSKKINTIGQLGVAIIYYQQDNQFSILAYTPREKKHQFEVEINQSFIFNILPHLFAAFSDRLQKRYWSIKFANQNDLKKITRHIVLAKKFFLTNQKSQSRKIIVQDLVLGELNEKEIQLGDQVKMKSNIYVVNDKYPIEKKMGDKIVIEPKRFVVGDDTISIIELQKGIVGMKKKSKRLMVIPRGYNNEVHMLWGSQVPSNKILLVEINISSVKSKRIVCQNKTHRKSSSTKSSLEPKPFLDRSSRNPLSFKNFEKQYKIPKMQEQSSDHGPGINKTKKSTSTPHYPTKSPGRQNSKNTKSDDQLINLMKTLMMDEYIEKFNQQHILYNDLLLLDSEEISTLIPQIGPRKRLIAKIREIKSLQVLQKNASEKYKNSTASHSSNDTLLFTNVDTFLKENRQQTNISPKDVQNACNSMKKQVVDQAKEKIKRIKSTAATKINQLQEELDTANEKNKKIETQLSQAKKIIKTLRDENYQEKEEKKKILNSLCKAETTINQAKEIIKKLREELRKEKHEKKNILLKSRQYVQQVRDGKEHTNGQTSKQIKDIMEQVFKELSSQMDKNHLYDGQTVQSMIKSTIKNVTITSLKHG